MNTSRLHRHLRWVVLFTSIVMMLAALAPAVSRAVVASGSEGWTEVCTSQGMQWVKLVSDEAQEREASDPNDSSRPGGLVIDHCAFCILVAFKPTPPMPVVLQGLTVVIAQLAPIPSVAPVLPIHTVKTAPPRAPPIRL